MALTKQVTSAICYNDAVELRFNWDDAKSRSNQAKHNVSFAEAATVFGDPLSVLIPDPIHSEDEKRWTLLGQSQRQRLLVVVHTERNGAIRLISARLATAKERIMKNNAAEANSDPEMLAEYDFQGGRRGVYAARYAEGTNLVALSPDIAAVFPDSESVNEALRTLVRAARRSIKAKPRQKREAA